VSECENGVSEGSHLYKRGQWYYLLTAEGGTGPFHQVWITRSRLPLGPFESPPAGINPLVYNATDPDVQRTGHADMVEGVDGRWWAVLLAVRPQETGLAQLGRETFLVPVEWSEDDWPIFNKGKKVQADIPADLPSRDGDEGLAWRDDFTSRKWTLYVLANSDS
jgi:beta-xylosidase